MKNNQASYLVWFYTSQLIILMASFMDWCNSTVTLFQALGQVGTHTCKHIYIVMFVRLLQKNS